MSALCNNSWQRQNWVLFGMQKIKRSNSKLCSSLYRVPFLFPKNAAEEAAVVGGARRAACISSQMLNDNCSCHFSLSDQVQCLGPAVMPASMLSGWRASLHQTLGCLPFLPRQSHHRTFLHQPCLGHKGKKILSVVITAIGHNPQAGLTEEGQWSLLTGLVGPSGKVCVPHAQWCLCRCIF